jgi:hypothetical protein
MLNTNIETMETSFFHPGGSLRISGSCNQGAAGPGERLRSVWETVKWEGATGEDTKASELECESSAAASGVSPYLPLPAKWILSGRLPLPSWMATLIALMVMLAVEGFHWGFGAGRRRDGTKCARSRLCFLHVIKRHNTA